MSETLTAQTWYSNNSHGTPANLEDGNLSTYVQSFTYCAADFGSKYTLEEITIAVHNVSAFSFAASGSLSLQGSNDTTDGSDGTWTDILTFTTDNLTAPTSYPGNCGLIAIDSQTSYRYYRLKSTTATTSLVINEWSLVGTADSAGTQTGTITAKSVVFDFADNYVHESQDYMSIRSIEFYLNGELIAMTSGYTAYATSTFNSTYHQLYAFNTSLAKTGSWGSTSWVSANYSSTEQRLIIVFDSDIEFDGIIINNGHSSGDYTACGVKNVVITASTDEITDTTYGAEVTNGTVIFDDLFAEHTAADEADDQLLELILPNSATVPWTPAEIDTTLWLDASDSDTVIIDTGVSTWVDKSGNGFDLLQSTTANQPTVNEAACGGLNTIAFDGDGDTLGVEGTGLTFNDCSVIGVLAYGVSNTTYEGYFSFAGPEMSDYDYNVGLCAHTSNYSPITTFSKFVAQGAKNNVNTADLLESSFDSGTYHLMVLNTNDPSDTTLAKLYIDGAEEGSYASDTDTIIADTMYLACRHADGSLQRHLNMEWAEFIVIPNSLYEEDRQKIEGYLAHKWGLEANLPTDHPYKSAAPQIAVAVDYTGFFPNEIDSALWLITENSKRINIENEVISIDDGTGYGRNLTAESDAVYPVRDDERKWLSFDGTQRLNLWKNGPGRAVAGLSMFALVNSYSTAEQLIQAVTAGFNTAMAGLMINHADNVGYISSIGGRLDAMDDALVTQLGTFTSGENTLIYAYWDFATGNYGGSVNGAEPTAVSSGITGTTLDSIRGFCLGGDNALETPFIGDWAGTVVLDFVPTEAQRQNLEGYFKHALGIDVTLPTDHPYYTDAPETTGTTYTPTIDSTQPVVDFGDFMELDLSGVPAEPAHNHYLGGVVKVDGAPGSKRIVVCDRVTLEYVAVTTSDPETGEWSISHLPEYDAQSLLTLAFDDSGTYNALPADFITQTTVPVPTE